MTENSAKRPIGLLYTGGTIGCAGTPLAPLPGAEFLDRLAATGLLRGREVEAEGVAPALDSTEMGPADWVRLARAALAMADRCRAVAILHGTDTMAWSAAALALLTTLWGAGGVPAGRLGVPLVLTGAQRPLLGSDGIARGTDAAANLSAALALAETAAPGTRLVFGGRVLTGARTVKVEAQADAAFAEPNGPADIAPLPRVDAAALTAQLDRLAPLLSRTAVLPVLPAPMPAGVGAAALEAALATVGDRPAALHLLGYGAGNFPDGPALAPVLREARARGVVVAAGTQVVRGRADPSTYAAGHWLGETGAWPTGDRAAPAVQAKLAMIAALVRLDGWDDDTARTAFCACHAGEGAV